MGDKVVFLDRDGVINRDSPGYIKSVAEFVFLPRSLEAIRLLTTNGFSVIVITNQSAIGRGMISPAVLEEIHQHLIDTVKENGGRIRDIFFCPHTPEENCDCRKPKPGLIFQAGHTYGIALSETVMVGDRVKDIQCGHAAGCGAAILVRTGNGDRAATALSEQHIPVNFLAEDLYDAVSWILSSPFNGPTP
ncbi:MAG: D-glycero-beta-D-manno-heptose 1,7-bisphosphate 7-phosphatase [Desulfobacterales bacterium]|jgi:D-glycero-D-manno-heptose 1,7-bisphosphate phosphatase|nr:D-glycero-beta-D-manno-heptose 1,7-bisphosphate 7-phosphatase [Desulfobacterales bacterium]